MARSDRPAPPDDDIFVLARRIDAAAWAERDRLAAEHGVNPDRFDQRPRSAAERRMQERRMYSLRVAFDKSIAGDDPEIARVLLSLHLATAH